MYSRSYYQTDTPVSQPPENYDGTAFMEERSQRELPYEAPDFIPEEKPSPEPPAESTEAMAKPSSIPFLSGFSGFSLGGIFGDGGILKNIGIEEILILAVAAYLLFSDSGDLECAIMLLLLLFIS